MDLYEATTSSQLDLPGVDPSTIDVDIDERTLTVRAERTDDEGRRRASLAGPGASGRHLRPPALGYGVALDRIAADYRDGVLTLDPGRRGGQAAQDQRGAARRRHQIEVPSTRADPERSHPAAAPAG